MKASSIIMTPDVLQQKPLWGKGEENKNLHLSNETGTFIQRKGRGDVKVTQYYLNILLLKLQFIYIKLSYRTLVCQLDQCTAMVAEMQRAEEAFGRQNLL